MANSRINSRSVLGVTGSAALAAMLALAALPLGGCDTVMDQMARRSDYEMVEGYTTGKTPLMTTAPADADYFLYTVPDDKLIARTTLKAGAPIGFKMDARDFDGKPVASSGTVSAVAGDFAVPTRSEKDYEWRMGNVRQRVTATSRP